MATVEFSPIVEQDYAIPQTEAGEAAQASEAGRAETMPARERAHTAAVMDTDKIL